MKTKGKYSIAAMLRSFENYRFLSKETLISSIPFFLFIVGIAICYIWNSHQGVKMVKTLRTNEAKMIELQWYYNATREELTGKSRQSSVAKLVEKMDIEELSNPPYLIHQE